MQTPAASVGCQAADVATTAIALHGGAVEANPIMGGILKSLGWPGFIAAKAFFAWVLVKETPQAPNAVATVNTATCAVAVHNLMVR